MSQAVAGRLLTTADLLAMPDDGVERYLIRGQLRERGEPGTTKRNRWHSRIEAWIGYVLIEWLERRPQPRGDVYSGEVGCILRHDPESTVGIDVAYFSAEVLARQTDATTMMDGVPVLAVEILSPNDVEEDVNEKVDEYLAAGVPLVWVVDPHFRTVRVYRPGAEPELFNATRELSGEPHLPGFRTPVARLFP
jgi:Uma2 family endonuclease